MSKFTNGQVFIILDDDEISLQVLNYSTSKTKETMPSKTSGGILKRIVETREPVNEVFGSYQWYGMDEIGIAWEAIIED